jgi:20S proteasome subunit alpha 6
MAIGARSQSARTYLEKYLNEFPQCSLDDLIKHALRALRDTLPNEVELTTKVHFFVFEQKNEFLSPFIRKIV